MKENILPQNSKGEEHGYYECYNYNKTKLAYRCVYKNGELIGYDEYHEEKETNFNIR
jgi:hypothetical protein